MYLYLCISLAICKFLCWNVYGICKLTLLVALLPTWLCKHALRLRHNEEVCELLDGPCVVKYMKFERLLWAGYIVWWIITEYQNCTEWKISQKTVAKMGSQHQEGLLVAAECKRMEGTIWDTHINSFWYLDKKKIDCILRPAA